MGKTIENVLELIGDTPLIRLRRVVRPGSASIWAKMECLNPSGSVKDRSALAMIRNAEEQGSLRSEDIIIEASAGNMGISLATVAGAMGYRLIIVLPDTMPLEHLELLRRLGADLYLTPTQEGMEGAHKVAGELVRRYEGHVMLSQFDNPACYRAHREHTAPEILEALQGKRIDAWVAGVGTGATLSGVGEALKEHNPNVLVIAVEPSSSPLLSEGRTGAHGIPGLGADFVPPLLRRDLVDEVITVSDSEAVNMMHRLGKEEGLVVGISSGANVVASLRIAERLGPEATVVTVLPDRGERYLSFR
ncbi:MAG: cysteine synthase A [Chloroflexi bacterium]|nr:cysteine synthase A [Chloroflexota bacterium]